MHALIIDNIPLRRLLEQSLAQAAVANPHRETNPVRTVDDWLAYVERFARLMPWQAMDIGEDASFFRRIDQNIGYFYFLLDQPLDVLKDKGYIYPSLQYEPRVAAWLKDYNTAWGEYLDSPDSWNDDYYRLAKTDSRFELDTDRYESPANWHSWNDFFARKLRSESRNPVIPSLRNSVRPFLSPSDGEIALAPVKTASISNWLDLLGDSPYKDCFEGGETTHIVLDVFDYHRFHAPCDGAVLECKTIEGIHAGGGVIIWDEEQHRYRYDQLGVTDFLVMETPDFGKIALVAVGVQQVSSVVWTHPALADSESLNPNFLNPNPLFAQGEELGLFKFGGSDIVLFFEPDKTPYIAPQSVKAGEPIIKIPNRS